MGTNQSKNHGCLNVHGSFYRHNVINDSKSLYQIWQDKVTTKQYKAFKVQQSFIMSQHNQQICYFRKINRTYLVGVFGIHSSQQTMCSISRQTYLLIDNLQYKIADLQRSLNLEDSLSIMQAVICGYQILNYLFGPIETSEDMIWFTQMGIPKVWANEDISKNEPSLAATRKCSNDIYNDGKIISLQQRYLNSLTSIIQTIQRYKIERYSSQFKQALSRSHNYDEALQIISLYCKNHQIQLEQSIKIKKYLRNTCQIINNTQIVNQFPSYKSSGQKSIKDHQVLNNFDPEGIYHNNDNHSYNLINYLNFIKEEELNSIHKNMDSIMTEKPRIKQYSGIRNDSTLKNSRVAHHNYIREKQYNHPPIIKFNFLSPYPIAQSKPQINQIPIYQQRLSVINPPVIKAPYSKAIFQQNSNKLQLEDNNINLQQSTITNKEQFSKLQSITIIQNPKQPQVPQAFVTFKNINYNNYNIIACNQQNKQIQSANYLISSYQLQQGRQQSFPINHPSQYIKEVNTFGRIQQEQNIEIATVLGEGQKIQTYIRNKYQSFLQNPSMVQRISQENSMSNYLNRYDQQSYSPQIKKQQNKNGNPNNPKIKQFFQKKRENASLKTKYNTESLSSQIQKFKNSLNKPKFDGINNFKFKLTTQQSKLDQDQFQNKDLTKIQNELNNKNSFQRLQRQRLNKNNRNIEQKYNKYVINRSGKGNNLSKGQNSYLRPTKIQQSNKQMKYTQDQFDQVTQQQQKLPFFLKPKRLIKDFKQQ